jgi:hypothetical protein
MSKKGIITISSSGDNNSSSSSSSGSSSGSASVPAAARALLRALLRSYLRRLQTQPLAARALASSAVTLLVLAVKRLFGRRAPLLRVLSILVSKYDAA